MADDSMKDLMQRMKNFRKVDPDATDIMDMNDIVDSEDSFGRTLGKQEFQDRVAANKKTRGLELLDKAKSRGKTTRWLPSIPDAGDTTKEVKRNILKKLGSGLGRRATGLAIGGPMMLASELADASEMGVSEDDKLLESTEYTPEQKEALKRGIETKRKLLRESGDVSQDPVVQRAKAISQRLQEAKDSSMTEDSATDRFDEKVSKEEYGKILKQMRDANRRK